MILYESIPGGCPYFGPWLKPVPPWPSAGGMVLGEVLTGALFYLHVKLGEVYGARYITNNGVIHDTH